MILTAVCWAGRVLAWRLCFSVSAFHTEPGARATGPTDDPVLALRARIKPRTRESAPLDPQDTYAAGKCDARVYAHYPADGNDVFNVFAPRVRGRETPCRADQNREC